MTLNHGYGVYTKTQQLKKSDFLLFLFLFICVLSTTIIHAQELPIEITDQIEAFLEDQEEEIDIINLYEQLRIFAERPININNATGEELRELRLLSDVQINALLYHRDQFGDLIHIAELQSIPAWNIDDIKRVQTFIQVSGQDNMQISFGQMLAQSRNELYLKWGRFVEEKNGFKKDDNGESNYLGNPDRYFVRYRNNYNNKLRMGFILEKDPGEQFMTSADNLGFDYLTAHIYLKDYSKFLKEVAVGDYTISLGQGLIAHNSFGSGKSAFVTNIKKGGRTIIPFNSVFENGYMRGAAATIRPVRHIEATAFYSKVNRDGNAVGPDTLSGLEPRTLFSSLQTTGNHRTASEIEDKGLFGIQSYGGVIKWRHSNWHIGINSLNHNFDDRLDRSDQPYNLFRFEGESLSNHSVDFSYRYKNFNFFGEYAYASSGGTAFLAGALLVLDKRVNLALMWRDYGVDYNALEPNALGESSAANNEKGMFIGLELLLSKNWKFRAYADYWKHPWLRFNINQPSGGKEYIARLDYTVKRKLNCYIQYSYENKLFNSESPENKITIASDQIRHRLRFHFSHKVNKALELRTRLEGSHFVNPDLNEYGYLMYQDVIFKPLDSKLSLTSRFAVFDTDGFDSRIYAYENALLYEFLIPAYFDQGFRYYFNLRYRLNYDTTLELRWARTHLTNQDSFSNGNEKIEGDTKSEIRMQLRYVF